MSDIRYRYKMPDNLHARMYTMSFGIEPYRINAKGKEVKAGKAIVRCVLCSGVYGAPFGDFSKSAKLAEETASEIVRRLNNGEQYAGPKVIDFDRPQRAADYFND